MVNGEEPDGAAANETTFTINPEGETARVEAAKVLVTTCKLLIDSKF